jgi:hypothetical protein
MSNKYHRQGFKVGTIRKILTTSGKKRADELAKNMELTDPTNLRKKDNIIDGKRKKFSYKDQIQEEPYNLDTYIDVIQSDFKNKTGPYFDRLKKLKGKK